MEDKYLTLSEIADRLKITRSCVYSFIRQRDFPSGYKLGRVRRWKERDVTAWIEQHALAKVAGQGEEFTRQLLNCERSNYSNFHNYKQYPEE